MRERKAFSKDASDRKEELRNAILSSKILLASSHEKDLAFPEARTRHAGRPLHNISLYQPRSL